MCGMYIYLLSVILAVQLCPPATPGQGLRLWAACCRLSRDSLSALQDCSFGAAGCVRSGAVVQRGGSRVFWTILNLLGQVTRRQQPLEKRHKGLKLAEQRAQDARLTFFPPLQLWARRCTYLRAIASVNARILGALESCNLPLRLHSLQSCNTLGPGLSSQPHRREKPPKQVMNTGT